MSKHDWKYFDFASKARCIRCGWEVKASVARVNASACPGGLTIVGPDATVIARASDFTDGAKKRDGLDGLLGGSQWAPEQRAQLQKSADMRDLVDKVSGVPLPEFGKIEQKLDLRSDAPRASDFHDRPNAADVLPLDVIDRAKKLMDETGDVKPFSCASHASIRSEALRAMADAIKRDASGVFTPGLLNVPRVERFETTDFGRYVVDTKTGRKYIAIELYERIRKLADDVARDDGQRRERAEALLGDRAKDDKLLVDLLCDEIERLRSDDDGEAAGQIEHLDRENARLRRELAEARQRLRGITFHANDAGELVRIDERDSQGNVRRVMWERKERRSDNVIRIEPFPEVQPYDGDWIPPSHKPRMLP